MGLYRVYQHRLAHRTLLPTFEGTPKEERHRPVRSFEGMMQAEDVFRPKMEL